MSQVHFTHLYTLVVLSKASCLRKQYNWCRNHTSNHQPSDLKSSMLTITPLCPHIAFECDFYLINGSPSLSILQVMVSCPVLCFQGLGTSDYWKCFCMVNQRGLQAWIPIRWALCFCYINLCVCAVHSPGLCTSWGTEQKTYRSSQEYGFCTWSVNCIKATQNN